MRSSVRLQAEQAVVGAWLVVALTAMTAVPAAAQAAAADGRADINVEVSSSDMIRRTAIYTAAGQGLNRAADAGLDALFGRTDTRRSRDVFARLGRIWLVNLPIAALAQGAAHDSGHFARLAEFGVHAGRRQMEQWPWPVPIAVSVELVPPPESFEEALAQGLAVLGGGEQGSTLTKQRLADGIYQRDSTGYFDWMLVAYSSLDYPIYAWGDLSGHIEAAFERGPGDFRQYAEFMTFLGAWSSAHPWWLIPGVAGAFLTSIYVLRVTKMIFWGQRSTDPHFQHLPDAVGTEWAAIVILVFVIVLFGVAPSLALGPIDTATVPLLQRLVGAGQ